MTQENDGCQVSTLNETKTPALHIGNLASLVSVPFCLLKGAAPAMAASKEKGMQKRFQQKGISVQMVLVVVDVKMVISNLLHY
ncbi:hypothetical protein P8452_28319 [Trifolium repens]|nr:hypothetical protein P8452_28319 [Trifolium repens]